MKVLFANKFFRNGGSETVMFQERDYLLGTGHEAIDFSMQDERNFPSPNAASFVSPQDYRIGEGKLKLAFSLIHSTVSVNRIFALIRQTWPDLVHCHNIYHQLTPSIIGVARKLGVTVVLTLHDCKPVCPTYNRCAEGSLGKSALLYAEAVVQRFMGSHEKVDAFIASSRYMQQSITYRVPDDRVKLLCNRVDTNEVRGSGAGRTRATSLFQHEGRPL